MSRVGVTVAALALAASLVAPGAAAGPHVAASSLGAPNAGKLAGAARLKPTRHIVTRQGAHTWALPTLVRLLHRASEAVAKKHKGTPRLFVGDLSAREGGALDGHNSHQSGRDVDVGFYVLDLKGRAVQSKRFVAFDGDGHARDPKGTPPALTFDDARNWAFVAALLEDKGVHVRYVFVSNPLKRRLLDFARGKGRAPKELVDRAAAAMLSPDHADVHDDHFHVRISCPASMDSCIEESTVKSGGAPAWVPLGTGHLDPQAEKPVDAYE